MSSPPYSQDLPTLSSGSTASNNEAAYRFDPGTPDTDPYAFSEADNETTFPQLQHGFADPVSLPYHDALQHSGTETGVHATTSGRHIIERKYPPCHVQTVLVSGWQMAQCLVRSSP